MYKKNWKDFIFGGGIWNVDGTKCILQIMVTTTNYSEYENTSFWGEPWSL